jgi:hypothetical protein
MIGGVGWMGFVPRSIKAAAVIAMIDLVVGVVRVQVCRIVPTMRDDIRRRRLGG